MHVAKRLENQPIDNAANIDKKRVFSILYSIPSIFLVNRLPTSIGISMFIQRNAFTLNKLVVIQYFVIPLHNNQNVKVSKNSPEASFEFNNFLPLLSFSNLSYA